MEIVLTKRLVLQNIDKTAIIKVIIPQNIYERLNHMNLDYAIFKSGTPVVERRVYTRDIVLPI